MSKSLDLKVILAARDKITGPLKKINATSSGTARALKQAQAETKDLQRQQSDIKSFRTARAGLRSVEQGLKATRSAQSDYQRSLESQRKTHDDIKRQTKEARAAYRSLAGQMQRTKEPTAALNRDFHLAAKRLSDLEVKQDRSYSSIKRYKEGIRSTDKQLGVLNKEKDRHSKNLDIARKKLNEAGISTKNLGRTQRDLTDQVRRANERIQRQKTYLEQLGKADVSGKFNNMTSEVTRFGRRALMATTGVAAGIFGLSNSTAGLGDHAAKTADKLGLTVEAYQEMVYAGERSGIAQNTMDSSMRRLVKRTGEAARGSGAAQQAFEALGLSASEFSKLPVDERLAVISDRMSSISNHDQRVDIASQLFGSNSGADMLNLLKDGSAGLQQLRRDARITGYVMSEESARDAEKFKDALLDAQLGLKGMKNTIGAELMPAVTDMMGQLFQWMSENRDQVKAFAREFGQRLKQAIPVIRDIAVGVWSAVRAIGSATARVAGLVGGFDNLAVIMVAMFAMKPVLAILAFGKSLVIAGKALAGFAGAFPIVQAALLKTTLLTKGLWFGVKAFIPKAAAAIFAFSKGVVAATALAGKALWAFTAGLAKMGIALLANPIVLIITGVAAAIAGAAYLIYKNWDGIAGWFSDRWGEIKQAWSEGLSGIGKLLINWSPVGLLYKGFSALMSWLGVDLPQSFTGFGKQILDGLVGGIMGGLNKVKDTITNAGQKTIGWFKDVLGIKSPSRVFMGAGRDTLEGYRRGLVQQEPKALKQVNTFGKRVRQVGAGIAIGASTLPAAADNVQFDNRPPISGPVSAAQQPAGDTITININAAQGQSAQEIAAEVDRILQARDRRKATRARSALYDRD